MGVPRSRDVRGWRGHGVGDRERERERAGADYTLLLKDKDLSTKGFFTNYMSLITAPAGSPSHGGDVTVYVYDINQPTLLTPFFIFCSCVYFCLYGPFNCISIHTFSLQLSVLSLCSSGFISVLLVISTICIFMNVSFSPDIIHNGWLGSKHHSTN